MGMATQYAVNKFLIDNMFRGQSNPMPPTWYVGLFVASKGYAARGTSYALGDTVVPATPNGRIYKCTTAGTSGASEPTWPTTNGGTLTDGSVVWTEQTPSMYGGTFTEATYTGYARVSIAASLANFAGSQGVSTTAASSGTSGQTSNNVPITFGAPTGNQAGVVAGFFLADSASNGNPCFSSMLAAPKTINNGDSAPSFPAAQATFSWM